jgi:hypothetical protein
MNDNDQIKAFSDFITFPIHIHAYTNEAGKIKKSCSSLPNEWEKLTKSQKKNLVYKKNYGNIKPNGIGVVMTGLSCIDIDQPNKCSILERLKDDCGFWVKTKNGFHFYYKKENVLPRQKLCKVADINTNLLYFVPTYTHQETGDEYHYEIHNNEALTDMPQYAIDWCLMLITMKETEGVSSNAFAKKVKKGGVEKIIIRPDIEIEKFDLKTMNEIFNIFYEAKLLNKYGGWRDAGYMGRHLNNSEEAFKLFDKYSKLVAAEKCKIKGLPVSCEKYKNKTRQAYYGKGEYNENFDENGVLIKCSKLNAEKFKTTLQYLYKSKWEEDLTNFDMKYIYPDDNTNDEMFNEWIKNFKCLGIRSAYGTGKTYAFKKLIDIFKFKRVLFITYRQSLAHSLSEELREKYGFDNYLDDGVDILNSKRLIIQLDSIKKLNGGYNFITQQDNMPKFDLVVLDEIEGLLNHLSFEKIDQFVIHDYLKRLMNKAPKILALDGDMNDRSYDFLSDICPTYKFYANDYKPNKKHFLLTHNGARFRQLIKNDLAAGLKLCIVSMTKSDTEMFNALYKDKYKVCLHNSIERNKEILKKTNEEWAKCDLLVYSPSVESGVDFNIENYFDKCYAVLNENSTSYRAFNQMLNRVRYYKNNEILCMMSPTMNYKVNEILYRFDEMRLTKYQGLEQSNLVDILIHNDTEKINSKNFFICSFINAITKKGHTHKYLNDRPTQHQQKKIKPKEMEIQSIVEAEIIEDAEYENLCSQQKQNKEISREDFWKVQKIYLSRIWCINPAEIDEGFLETHYGYNEMPKKFNRLNVPLEKRPEKNDKKILANFEWEKCDKLHELFKKVGYEVKDHTTHLIEKKDFETSTKEIIDFVKDKTFKTMFNNDRTLKDINLLKIINKTLYEYGLALCKKKINGKRDENGEQQISYEHNLVVIDQIEEYIERKKTKTNEEAE